MQAAVVHKDITRALHDLHEAPQQINRLGKPIRLLEPDVVRGWLRDAGFQIVAEYGIRCVSDLMDKAVAEDAANFDLLLELETWMMAMPAYVHTARFVQVIACKRITT
jgi:hypothetical protein